MSKKKVALSGDRPSGKLHLGHFVGSLKNRLKMQDTHDLFIMIADLQALTDNFANPEKVRDSVFQVCLDYLSVGLDPEKVTFFIQSQIVEISELTKLYLNFVTLSRLQRNPTVKEEIKKKGFEESIPVGFLVYPVSQAADITCIDAEEIPVGQDQLPMIEQCNEIVDSINGMFGQILTRTKAIIPEIGARLPGTNGSSKMGKSEGNAIYLSDSSEDLKKKVMSMYTDPNHLRVQDPGQVEGNTVFTYLDIFARDQQKVAEMKAHYQRGGLGDVAVKQYLFAELDAFLTPIRARRAELEKTPEVIWNILEQGSNKTSLLARKTLQRVKQALKIDYFN